MLLAWDSLVLFFRMIGKHLSFLTPVLTGDVHGGVAWFPSDGCNSHPKHTGDSGLEEF